MYKTQLTRGQHIIISIIIIIINYFYYYYYYSCGIKLFL